MKVVLAIASLVLCACNSTQRPTDFPDYGATAEPVVEPPVFRRDMTAGESSNGGTPDAAETAAPIEAPSSPVGEGFTRLAGGSTGWASLDWNENAQSNLALAGWVEMGKLLSDSFEVGVQVTLGLGVGGEESFSGLLDPGLYGRLYFGDLSEGITPWIRGDLLIRDLIAWGEFDEEQETSIDAVLSLGVTKFLMDGMALEVRAPVVTISEDGAGDMDARISITDDDQQLFIFGLAFFW